MSTLKGTVSAEITGHKLVREALRDTATYSSDLQGDADVRSYRQIPLEVDPPRHHLYRAALTPYFVRPAIEKLIPSFEKFSSMLISDVLPTSQDLVSNLALPLVMHNLGEIYNRPQDVDEWISWGPDVWTAGGGERSGDVLHRYLESMYVDALSHPRNDMWGHLIELKIDGEVISKEEFFGIAGVLLAGERDTVVKLLSGIVWHFGNWPEDLDYLQEHPEDIDNAIQELLRYMTPLPVMARTTTPESSADPLPDDRYVHINFLSGNFDASVFDTPLEINIKRTRIPHLSFGFGPHTCLGNHVAEIEAKVFLRALIESGIRWSISPESKIHFYEAPMDAVPRHFEVLKATAQSRL